MLAPWSCLRKISSLSIDILHINVEYAFLGSWLNFILLPLFITIAKILSRAKIVITLHGVPNFWSLYHYLEWMTKFPTFISFLLSFTYSIFSYISISLSCILSNAIVVHTDLMKQALTLFISKRILYKIHVIEHGSYKPTSSMEKAISDKNTITILIFGYQRPSKGLKTLLKAVEEIGLQIDGLRLMIVGKKIHRFFEKNTVILPSTHVKIEIIDKFLEEEILDNIIRKSDIIVLPYEDMFYEVSGVLYRVALFGKPIICSNIPRFYSCLTDKVDALFFSPGNHLELADRLYNLIKSPSLAKNLSRNIVKKFSHMTWEKVSRKYEKLFINILKSS